MIILGLIIISIFLALNMGVSGFSVSFTPSYGSKILTRIKATLLYAFCVLLGGLLIGPRVLETLVQKISLQTANQISSLIILSAAAVTMFTSNLLKIPQSTSFVTVGAFVGAGLFYHSVNWLVLAKIIIVALIFSVLSFKITRLITKKFYPLNGDNLSYHERYYIHQNKFKRFIVYTDMYSAFGIGTNNVANVIAPLISSLALSPYLGLSLAAPLFGIGAYLFGERVINTVSKEIVPIGEITAAIVSLVTATFVIIASLWGLPTPYVQFTTFSIFAISCAKDGSKRSWDKSVVKRIISVWIAVPLVTVILSYILHLLFLKN